jgi:hypothetical protein
MKFSKTEIESAFELLNSPPKPRFTLPTNRYHKTLARQKLARGMVGIRKLIRPENALAVLPHLPKPDERTEAILNGDFVLCDLIPAIIAHRGKCAHLRATSLSLSGANAQTLADLHKTGKIGRLTLVVSHYFRHVDSTDIFLAVTEALKGVTRPHVCRMHCKVVLIPTSKGDWFTLSGSANLRSSNCLEQLSITNDRATHDFHTTWIDTIACAPLE